MRPESHREKFTLAGEFDNLVTGMDYVVEGDERPAGQCAGERLWGMAFGRGSGAAQRKPPAIGRELIRLFWFSPAENHPPANLFNEFRRP
jgi:hypothetical protein